MSEHTHAVIETSGVITSSAVKTTVVGGGVSFISKVAGMDPMAIIGLVVGIGGLIVSVLGFLVSWHYKRQENQRAKELHELKKKNLLGECDVKD